MKTQKMLTIAMGLALAVGLLGGAHSARATLTENFDSYTAGALNGQGGWDTSPLGTSSGMDVFASGSPLSAPNVLQVTDADASTHAIRRLLTEPSAANVSFSARHMGNNLANNSGLFLRLDADVVGPGYSPDPFFQVGFSPANGGIHWDTFGPTGSGDVASIINNTDWYGFFLQYDISSAATHYVNLSVVNLSTTASVLSTNLVMVGNQGGRFELGSLHFVTGGTHQSSLFEIDNVSVGVPEPSLAALTVAGIGVLALRRRCRS